MHRNAMNHAKLFFETYVSNGRSCRILDIGALDVNGSLKAVAPAGCQYVGADFAEGNGVDVILDDPYQLPFEDNSFDVCVSSSCFEHSEFFWLSFNEILRVLKPAGLLYINSPSNGLFHRYPVDCWRFYPDAAKALERWAQRSGYSCAMLESFIGNQVFDSWNDWVSVFVKDAAFAKDYPDRITHKYKAFTNGTVYGSNEVLNLRAKPEDLRIPSWLRKAKIAFHRIRAGQSIR